MTTTTHSSHWYRIAELRPRLRAQVRVQRRRYRDETWLLLTDPVHGRHHMIDEAAYRLAGRLDGQRSVAQIWDAVCALDPRRAPTQDEFLALLSQLSQAELLQAGVLPDLQETFNRQSNAQRRRRRAALNPLALRVPLLDPRPWLARWAPRLRFLFHPLALASWLVLVLFASVLAALHWPALASQFESQALSTRFLLLSWCAYPLIKLLHELAHALAVHRWGGEVRRMGVSVLLLLPAPYVDASAATEFASRRRRVAVSAAGVAVELGLAAIALCVWVAVQPGWVRDVALVVAAIGSLSTLLVNANPLVRFDGYHVLCDALALPNLATRSRNHWIALLRKRLLGVRETPIGTEARGERKWLIAYAPASWLYQASLCVAAALWISDRSAALAAIVICVSIFTLALRPLWRAAVYLLSSTELSTGRRPAALRRATAVAFIALLALWLPLPASTTAQGIAWTAEDALVRVQTEGFVQAVHVKNGQRVRAGDALVTLEDAELVAQLEQANAEREAATVEYRYALERDLAAARGLESQLARRAADAKRLQQRVDELVLRSRIDGPVALISPDDLAGRMLRKGELVGYVLAGDQTMVKVAVPQEDSVRVRELTRSVSAQPMDRMAQASTGSLIGEVPAAGAELPSAALGSAAGGAILTDPSDKDGVRAIEPVAVFDVRLPHLPADRLGGRVLVRFDHGVEPLALQWSRQLRQLFLRHVEGDGSAFGVARAEPRR
jgi:putative peptide zinc metalloprotease protein